LTGQLLIPRDLNTGNRGELREEQIFLTRVDILQAALKILRDSNTSIRGFLHNIVSVRVSLSHQVLIDPVFDLHPRDEKLHSLTEGRRRLLLLRREKSQIKNLFSVKVPCLKVHKI
jgi:hypothetical protein